MQQLVAILEGVASVEGGLMVEVSLYFQRGCLPDISAYKQMFYYQNSGVRISACACREGETLCERGTEALLVHTLMMPCIQT